MIVSMTHKRRGAQSHNAIASPLARRLGRLGDAIRFSEWWDFKFVPILMIFYLTSLHSQHSVAVHWRDLAMLIIALVPGASYVSLLNDWTDRKQDAIAGRQPRACGRRGVVLAISICLLAGALVAWDFRQNTILVIVYTGSWLAFTSYSVPPFRLKTRGFPGVMADAAGANMFPSLLAATLASDTTDYLWLSFVAMWSLGYGIRGILRHQLLDEHSDRIACVTTFVWRRGAGAAVRTATRAAVPLEMFGLVAILHLANLSASLIALIAYYLYTELRTDFFRMYMTLVQPKDRSIMIGQEYYDFFLPVALLITMAFQDSRTLIVLIAHLCIFPRRTVQLLSDILALFRCARAR